MSSNGGMMLTGNAAAAWGARVSDVDYIAAYPITPQTEIVELLSKWVSSGELKARFVEYESEHSMLAGAGGAALAGARAFTATSSQGLAFAFENLYAVSGWRAPMVMVNVSRGLGMPMTLQVDNTDVLSVKDTGWLQLHAETCQEILDFIILAYRLGEDRRVLLPVIVNMDGFFLSFTREPVYVPSVEEVREFLPPYEPPHGIAFSERELAYAPTIILGHSYTYFRYQMHLAALKAKEVFYEISRDFEKIFGRSYSPVEKFMLDDAEYAIVSMNSFTSIIKGAVKRLREEGLSVGVLKINMFRPFPVEEIAEALRGKKGVAVFELNLSTGGGGIIYPELLKALYHLDERPKVVLDFVGGLGGKELTYGEIRYMVRRVIDAYRGGEVSPHATLLFTEEDTRRMIADMELAGKSWGGF